MGDVALVQELQRKGIRDERVLSAMAMLTRAEFMAEDQIAFAHEDAPSPIGHGQTISQPFVVAYMTEVLAVEPGMRVLEVGTGSGYQAAVLALLGADVYSVERIPELLAVARDRFLRLHLPVHTLRDDGSEGWAHFAPFDRIIVTAAADKLPQRLVDQLAAPGRMIAPVGSQESNQELVLIDRDASGALTWRTLLSVRFVPLIGGDAATSA